MKSFFDLEAIVKQGIRIVGVRQAARDCECKPEGLYKWMSGKCSISLGKAEMLYRYLYDNYNYIFSLLYNGCLDTHEVKKDE